MYVVVADGFTVIVFVVVPMMFVVGDHDTVLFAFKPVRVRVAESCAQTATFPDPVADGFGNTNK